MAFTFNNITEIILACLKCIRIIHVSYCHDCFWVLFNTLCLHHGAGFNELAFRATHAHAGTSVPPTSIQSVSPACFSKKDLLRVAVPPAELTLVPRPQKTRTKKYPAFAGLVVSMYIERQYINPNHQITFALLSLLRHKFHYLQAMP